MKILIKIIIFFSILVLSSFLAGIYGVVHNQLSYTISPEYFTRFKFIQFGLDWAYQSPRIGTGLVGFFATWWVGFILSIPLGLLGFIFFQAKQMFVNVIKSMFLVMMIAMVVGFVGLIFAYYQVNSDTVGQYMSWVREGVLNPVQFVRAGFMHNASYLGGLVGFIVGMVYLIRLKVQ